MATTPNLHHRDLVMLQRVAGNQVVGRLLQRAREPQPAPDARSADTATPAPIDARPSGAAPS